MNTNNSPGNAAANKQPCGLKAPKWDRKRNGVGFSRALVHSFVCSLKPDFCCKKIMNMNIK